MHNAQSTYNFQKSKRPYKTNYQTIYFQDKSGKNIFQMSGCKPSFNIQF